jgi:hypothetical protein
MGRTLMTLEDWIVIRVFLKSRLTRKVLKVLTAPSFAPVMASTVSLKWTYTSMFCPTLTLISPLRWKLHSFSILLRITLQPTTNCLLSRILKATTSLRFKLEKWKVKKINSLNSCSIITRLALSSFNLLTNLTRVGFSTLQFLSKRRTLTLSHTPTTVPSRSWVTRLFADKRKLTFK